MLGLFAATVLLLAVPLATRVFIPLWLLAGILGAAVAFFLFATFGGWTGDPHGFGRLLALLLVWPFVIGLLARGLVLLLDRASDSTNRSGSYGQLIAVSVVALPVAVAPLSFIVVGS
jgi:hypothetical protein